MSEQEFKRAFGYANTALDLLHRGRIPPYPQFYELLYTYATGANPQLNARINAIFQFGATPDHDLATKLYDEFLKAHDAHERLNSVSERMSHRIEAVHDAIDAALGNANSFSATLQSVTDGISDAISPEALREMARQLLAETQRMQDTNHKLEQKLEAARDDLSALQRDLDEARKESMLDPLTKIFNRKCFDEGLTKAMAEAATYGEPLSLVMIDIDQFKQFNDTYGHQTGDQVLRLVAMTLKSNIKGKDLAARYGGEEFAAILPSTDYAAALHVAENVRKALQAKELLKRSTNEKLGRITASFGVASYRPGDTPSSLLERADRCLYAAKHSGRNCVVGEIGLAAPEHAEKRDPQEAA
ncbi:diguanylate cyclase [Paradevosia shaoguanensis]|uniref:GGDEF domain-containing protein n=1 Tax=Paradevosia shaoguanensis TaxID=1335043 RepID=UPI003C743B85